MLYFESKAGKMLIYKDGAATDYSEEEATKILSEPDVAHRASAIFHNYIFPVKFLYVGKRLDQHLRL